MINIAHAQALQQITNANQLKDRILSIGDVAIYLLVSLAVFFIVWNVVIYMIRGDDVSTKKTAAANTGWGLLGLFIILSIWGLVNFLTNTFATNTQVPSNRFPTTDFTNTSHSRGLYDAPQGYGQCYAGAC